uniref:Putative inositol phospholipid synthesis protein scs3p n=1 Tax=Tabanus bromius TaxID=304241 RepID=A0A0K8TSM9_TABBR
MNFRPSNTETPRNETKGTRPTATPTSVREVLLMMILHICKKFIFFDTNLKVGLYLCSLFLVSLIGDFMPFPRTYFARSDNLFNVYFVKMGWAWTLVLSGPFLFMTSYTLCCGNTQKLLKQHLPRILIATGFWFVWTKLFNIVETSYGRCSARSFYTKSSCLKAGHLWYGFDISGHAFILIYSSLVLIEEAKPIIKWESIREHLRNEEHNRNIAEPSSSNPLRNLTDTEIKMLKTLYEKYTPAIRTLFIGMAALQLLWDVMLISTMLYYHRMVEKVLSGIIAVLTWFFTYRAWYPSTFLPDPAGRGNFIYQRDTRPPVTLRRQPSLTPNNPTPVNIARGQVPKFMGMPLYTNMKAQQQPPTSTPPKQSFSTDLVT